jgi:cyclopropane fatty-acyl-phospholipid synthase-like methyltransferase
VLKKLLVGAGVLPSRFLWLNPFKIVEYEELLRGIDIRPADVILDLGCGGGPQDLLLARKAARVVRLWASEYRHRRAEHGMFLCASAVKAL